jgi:hypothetical protein
MKVMMRITISKLTLTTEIPHLEEKARLRTEFALLNGWIWCSGCSES